MLGFRWLFWVFCTSVLSLSDELLDISHPKPWEMADRYEVPTSQGETLEYLEPLVLVNSPLRLRRPSFQRQVSFRTTSFSRELPRNPPKISTPLLKKVSQIPKLVWTKLFKKIFRLPKLIWTKVFKKLFRFPKLLLTKAFKKSSRYAKSNEAKKLVPSSKWEQKISSKEEAGDLPADEVDQDEAFINDFIRTYVHCQPINTEGQLESYVQKNEIIGEVSRQMGISTRPEDVAQQAQLLLRQLNSNLRKMKHHDRLMWFEILTVLSRNSPAHFDPVFEEFHDKLKRKLPMEDLTRIPRLWLESLARVVAERHVTQASIPTKASGKQKNLATQKRPPEIDSQFESASEKLRVEWGINQSLSLKSARKEFRMQFEKEYANDFHLLDHYLDKYTKRNTPAGALVKDMGISVEAHHVAGHTRLAVMYLLECDPNTTPPEDYIMWLSLLTKLSQRSPLGFDPVFFQAVHSLCQKLGEHNLLLLWLEALQRIVKLRLEKLKPAELIKLPPFAQEYIFPERGLSQITTDYSIFKREATFDRKLHAFFNRFRAGSLSEFEAPQFITGLKNMVHHSTQNSVQTKTAALVFLYRIASQGEFEKLTAAFTDQGIHLLAREALRTLWKSDELLKPHKLLLKQLMK